MKDRETVEAITCYEWLQNKKRNNDYLAIRLKVYTPMLVFGLTADCTENSNKATKADQITMDLFIFLSGANINIKH